MIRKYSEVSLKRMFHTELIPVRSRTSFKNYHTESKLYDSPPQMQYVELLVRIRIKGYGKNLRLGFRSVAKVVHSKIFIFV